MCRVAIVTLSVALAKGLVEPAGEYHTFARGVTSRSYKDTKKYRFFWQVLCTYFSGKRPTLYIAKHPLMRTGEKGGGDRSEVLFFQV